MSKIATHYIIFSPDNFPIAIQKSYTTPKAAWAGFERWKKGYQSQGYYATVRDAKRIRIPLAELKQHCTLNEIQLYE